MNRLVKFFYVVLATLVFLSLVIFNVYELVYSVGFIGKRVLPFFVTKQLGIDSIGMLFKPESFTKVLPLSYIKEINGIKVFSDEDLYRIVNELPDEVSSVKIKFSNPFFFYEDDYIVDVNVYRLEYKDFILSFLIPVMFSLILCFLSYFFAISLIKNYSNFTVYKVQMFLGAILLFLIMGLLVVSGLDLVVSKRFLPVLYVSFAFTGTVISLFFYFFTYFRFRLWIYFISLNIIFSSIFLTGYAVFFDNSRLLLSFVKLNYVLVALNVFLGIIYLLIVRKFSNNVIEKHRIVITSAILILPISALAFIFFIQGISFHVVPISVFFVIFVLVVPIVFNLVSDHNLKLSRERVILSLVISLIVIVSFFLSSGILSSVSSDSLVLLGVYAFPSVLFILVAFWYSLENKVYLEPSVFDIPSNIEDVNVRVFLFNKLRKRFRFIKDVEIILQYPIVYAEGVHVYMPHSEIWDSVKDKVIITVNDVFYDVNFSKFKMIFENFGVDYIFTFQMGSNKCILGISTTKAMSQSDLDQMGIILDSFSLELQSFSVINSVRFMKIISFEFDLLRQSQTNLLKSNKSFIFETPHGRINILNYWEPIVELAGDIYGINSSGPYLTSWISDICGKGLSAAAISFTCYTLINQLIKNNISISKSAEIMNDILVNEPLFGIESFFLTLSGITINTQTMDAEIINCGNPPVVFFDGNEVKELDPKGGIIGVFDKMSLEAFRVKVSKGMIFLFFSDGFIDILGKEYEDYDRVKYLEEVVGTLKNPEIVWERVIMDIKALSSKGFMTDDIVLSMVYID